MFEHFETAPPDPILGLTVAYLQDPNPDKINLSVGVYQDETGRTPILRCVKEAEARLLESETTKTYLPIDGTADYAKLVGELMLGAGHPALAESRVAAAHTPGGTAALRVAADLIHTALPRSTVWLSDPTWPNHTNIFRAAGVPMEVYPYFDADGNDLALDLLLETLEKIPAGDVVLLHGCCHNPTGVDPSGQAWSRIAEVIERRELLPLVDFAYQGFGDGLSEDAGGLLELCRPGVEMLVCSSFSKNFGLYNERAGAITVIGAAAESTAAVHSQVKQCIRANYSNPPSHGGAIVSTVLGDMPLRQQWLEELDAMRARILRMRELFVERLAAQGIDRDFSFIARQRGMFSFSGLSPAEVDLLREKYAIYIVRSGRINVAGMSEATMDRLCEAIADVIEG